MKAASINELKRELNTLQPKELIEICIRLARYKKDNKELLSYLLFEAHNEHAFVDTIKKEIDELFIALPKTNLYFTKKSLRKILRLISKYSKHTGSKESAIEMRLHFCLKLKESGICVHKDKALLNLYNQQLKKLNTLIKMVHEDLAFDYKKQLEQLAQPF